MKCHTPICGNIHFFLKCSYQCHTPWWKAKLRSSNWESRQSWKVCWNLHQSYEVCLMLQMHFRNIYLSTSFKHFRMGLAISLVATEKEKVILIQKQRHWVEQKFFWVKFLLWLIPNLISFFGKHQFVCTLNFVRLSLVHLLLASLTEHCSSYTGFNENNKCIVFVWHIFHFLSRCGITFVVAVERVAIIPGWRKMEVALYGTMRCR